MGMSMNGDDDPSTSIVGSGTDMGGGMYSEPTLDPGPDPDDIEERRVLRRTAARRPRRKDTRHQRRRT